MFEFLSLRCADATSCTWERGIFQVDIATSGVVAWLPSALSIPFDWLGNIREGFLTNVGERGAVRTVVICLTLGFRSSPVDTFGSGIESDFSSFAGCGIFAASFASDCLARAMFDIDGFLATPPGALALIRVDGGAIVDIVRLIPRGIFCPVPVVLLALPVDKLVATSTGTVSGARACLSGAAGSSRPVGIFDIDRVGANIALTLDSSRADADGLSVRTGVGVSSATPVPGVSIFILVAIGA